VFSVFHTARMAHPERALGVQPVSWAQVLFPLLSVQEGRLSLTSASHRFACRTKIGHAAQKGFGRHYNHKLAASPDSFPLVMRSDIFAFALAESKPNFALLED
jgi:hypothetical protein